MPVNKLTCWVVFIGLIFLKLLAKHGGRGDREKYKRLSKFQKYKFATDESNLSSRVKPAVIVQ